MFGARSRGRDHGSHRFDALAFAREDQSDAIILQRTNPIGVTDHAGQSLDINRKTRLILACRVIHGDHQPPLN